MAVRPLATPVLPSTDATSVPSGIGGGWRFLSSRPMNGATMKLPTRVATAGVSGRSGIGNASSVPPAVDAVELRPGFGAPGAA